MSATAVRSIPLRAAPGGAPSTGAATPAPKTPPRPAARVFVHPTAFNDVCDCAVRTAIRRVRRRFTLTDDQAEDLTSELWVKVAAHRGRVLQRFRGEGTLATYFTTVAGNLLRDRRNHEWGKWRPATAARQNGNRGVRLDRLLRRDGFSIDEAENWFRTLDPAGDHRWIRQLAGELPASRCRLVSTETVPEARLPVVMPTDLVDRAEVARSRRDALSALSAAIAEVPTVDRQLLLDRYVHGVSIAQLAASAGQPAKPLYRHCERLRLMLRRRLEAHGVTRGKIDRWLGDGDDGSGELG